MPTFSPSGIVHLGHVPFDDSYNHTYIKEWSNSSAQASDFITNFMTAALTENTYTYIRLNSSIRVNRNAEQLYGYNYCMFQNRNYGNKWFYAFIEEAIYINENCTELVVSIDVIQTWWFELNIQQCYVEREHVEDDTRGKNIVPEPSLPLEYQYYDFQTRRMSADYIVLLVNAYPFYLNPIGTPYVIEHPVDAKGSIPLEAPGIIQRQVNGCVPLVYIVSDLESMRAFKEDIKFLNQVGAADTISDAFTLPTGVFTGQQLEQFTYKRKAGSDTYEYTRLHVWTIKEATLPSYNVFNIDLPTQFEEFIPKNNKCLTAPFMYLEVGDFSGRTTQWRYEFFKEDDQGNIQLMNTMAANGDCQGYITPLRYNGVDLSTGEQDETLVNQRGAMPFTYDYQNKISWVYSTFENWMAQNAVGNAIAVLGSGLSLGGSITAGVVNNFEKFANTAANKMLTGPKMQRTLDDIARMTARGSTNSTHFDKNSSLAKAMGALSNMSGVGGVFGLLGVYANIERMRVVPNEARGNVAGNSRFQSGYSGYYYACRRLVPDIAESVDQFFTMYGYAVDKLKVPDLFSRPNWNYVKCSNSDHHGNIPQSDLSLINRIFNSGITFWHTTDIGNYSLDNQAPIGHE